VPAKPQKLQFIGKFAWKLKWPLIIMFALGIGVCLFYSILAGRYDLEKVWQIPERSFVYAHDDKLYSRMGGENRVVIPLGQVPDNFQKALLAREDSRFYKHHGVDYRGIARAMYRNIIHVSFKEGASTLTQQLARNSFELGGKNIHRKLLEAFVAKRIERHYSKGEILGCYVNRIYFGSGVYGLETASLVYFGKPASKLNLSEAATLAGIIRSPNRFSPARNIKGAYAQRDTVLDRMVTLKYITSDQAKKAKKSRLLVTKKRAFPFQENYAMDAVRNELASMLDDDEIDQGGLRIYTALDADLQKIADNAVDKHLTRIEGRGGWAHPKKAQAVVDSEADSTDYIQGALVAIDNRTGGIRALSGGRDYRLSRYNRAIHSQRQVGSTFKPFVYLAAFEQGMEPDTPIDDGPIVKGEVKSGRFGSWQPANSDGTYNGMQPAYYGLIHSRNTMSVRIGEMVGLDQTRKVAALIGLGEDKDIPNVPSIYLGAFETSLLKLTAAYTALANEGVLKKPYLIRKVVTAKGVVLFENQPEQMEIFDREATLKTSGILEKVLQTGTASSARGLGFSKRAAGKTGTTDSYFDAWFVGYTESLTCGVWVGFDKPKTIMNQGYGSVLALPIWVDLMENASSSRYPAGSLDVISPNESLPQEVGRKVEGFFDKIGKSIGKIFK